MLPDDYPTYADYERAIRHRDLQIENFSAMLRDLFHDMRHGEKLHIAVHPYHPIATKFNRAARVAACIVISAFGTATLFVLQNRAVLSGDTVIASAYEVAITAGSLAMGALQYHVLKGFWRRPVK